MSSKLRLSVAACIWVVLAIFVTIRWEVTTDISKFLPVGEDAVTSQLSRAMATSSLSRTIILSIEGSSTEEVVQASRLLETHLDKNPTLRKELSYVEGGPPPGIDESLWELYHPKRLGLAARTRAEAKHLVSDDGLRKAAARLKRRLASPLSTLLARGAPQDPFLTVPRLLRDLQGEVAEGMTLVDGRYIADDDYAILFLGVRASAFDADRQREVLTGIRQAFSEVKRQIPDLRLESSGLSRFSVKAKESIVADIKRISLLSVFCLVTLCLLFFRSLRLVLLAVLPVSFGMLSGMAALLGFFGQMHGLTLAFGASLIGVCVDYVLHFYVHHLDQPDTAGPRTLMRHLWPALALGATTTVVGFVVLIASTFPGLQQAAVFGAVGVTAALLSTWLVLPELMPANARGRRLRSAVSQWLSKVLYRISFWQRALWGILLLALGFAVWGASSSKWDGDLSKMTRFDRALQEEDARVRERVAQFEQSRFVVAVGPDEQAALAANDSVPSLLEPAVRAGELDGFQGIAEFLPSARLQERVADILRKAHLRERFGAALSAQGLQPSAFEPFFDYVDESKDLAPLSYEDWRSSNAEALVRPFRIELDDAVGFVTFLRNVHHPRKLAQRLKERDSLYFVDQGKLMRSASKSYMQRIGVLLGVGLIAVLSILWIRYRRIRIAAAAICPAVLAVGTTVGALTAVGISMNILALTALLMVLSMGADYGVFLAEANLRQKSNHAAGDSAGLTLMGMLVACLSTVFGFGVLSLSQHPALHTIGLVAAVGVTASLVLAPIALVLSRSPEHHGRPQGETR